MHLHLNIVATTKKPFEAESEEVEGEYEGGWVLANEDDAAHFKLDMHQNLGDPTKQLGMDVEEDESENITDYKSRFGEKLLWDNGVNVTALEENDLRCGGIVLKTNMSGKSNMRLDELAADCMVQECQFRSGGPDICPPDYIESDDRIFWIYFFLRFLATTMLSAGECFVQTKYVLMLENRFHLVFFKVSQSWIRLH